MKAIWNDQLLAESDETVIVDNNHYFPDSSLNHDYFKVSDTKTRCFWKGEAHYYSIEVNDKTNKDAAWYYPEPKKAAKEIKHHVAFWRGVKVTE